MRQFALNGRWMMWAPDHIADWDGLTGSPEAHTGWEYERLQAIQEHHHYGDFFYDIGAEHGILSALIAREFVGPASMVLFEPSDEFWTNIRRTWESNGLAAPVACFQGFADETSTAFAPQLGRWPTCARPDEEETAAMPYRSLSKPADAQAIPAIKIDDFAYSTGIFPASLNIDVEGAELRVLRGARALLTRPDMGLINVFLSVHPDLMQRDYGSSPDELDDFMGGCGWLGRFLESDHEDHWHYTRKATP